MELYVFNQNDRQLAGIVEAFEYFRWTRRYSRCGSFELKAIATDSNLALLQIGNILWKNDDEEAGLIEFVEISAQEQEFIEVSGRFATSFLARRIVWGTATLHGDLGEAVGNLIQSNLLEPSDESRRMEGITYTAPNLEVPINTQTSYRNLMDAVTGLCDAADVGIKTAFDPKAGTFAIQLYHGADSEAVFTKEYENIIEQIFTRSAAEYANFALVGGEGEGSERTLVQVGGGAGENRYEIFVDAKDLREEDIGQDYYDDALSFRGQQKLAAQAMVQAFDATVNQYGNLTYKTDFDIGSKIKAVSKRWGVSLTARITEIEESYDREGMSLDVTFGKPLLTIGQKLGAEIKDVQSAASATGASGGGISDGGVTTQKLADNSVTTAKIAAGAVVTPDLADGAVTIGKISADALPSTSNTYAQRLVTDSYQNAGAVDLNTFLTAGEFTLYNVTTATNFPTGTWTGSGNTPHLTVQRYYSGSVVRQFITKRNATTEMYTRTCSSATSWTAWTKILTSSLTAADLPDGVVNTAEIADGAVTLAKMSTNADTSLTYTAASGVSSVSTYSYRANGVVNLYLFFNVTTAVAGGGTVLTITDSNFFPLYETRGAFVGHNGIASMPARITASGVVSNAGSGTMAVGYYTLSLAYSANA